MRCKAFDLEDVAWQLRGLGRLLGMVGDQSAGNALTWSPDTGAFVHRILCEFADQIEAALAAGTPRGVKGKEAA